METIPCPGCRTDLEPSATVCPICTRPRNKLEITRGFTTLREMEKQRKKRPFIIAGRVLAAAAVGAVLFRFQEPVLNFAVSAPARASKYFNYLIYGAEAEKPAAPAEAPAAATPPPPAQGSVVSAPAAPAPSAAVPAAPAPAAEKIPRRAARVEDLPIPPVDPSWQWVFYGRAYDLITLQPVANAQLNFTSVSQYQRGGAGTDGAAYLTDSDGRFVVSLRRLPDGSSFEIHTSRPGYASAVLYESDIPYATLPLADRKEMARNAQDGDMTLPPLTDTAGETAIRRDVFLAPSR